MTLNISLPKKQQYLEQKLITKQLQPCNGSFIPPQLMGTPAKMSTTKTVKHQTSITIFPTKTNMSKTKISTIK